jgi:hypothetical protein
MILGSFLFQVICEPSKLDSNKTWKGPYKKIFKMYMLHFKFFLCNLGTILEATHRLGTFFHSFSAWKQSDLWIIRLLFLKRNMLDSKVSPQNNSS